MQGSEMTAPMPQSNISAAAAKLASPMSASANRFSGRLSFDHKTENNPPGFLQAYSSSKPPQSVASVNISTMMEDSESLIRAYKKKRAELETLRDQFYSMETQFFTVSQKHVIIEEENTSLKNRVTELERLLKES